MLDGALRGRNELIQDSIYRDTGIRRCRKQVSSHLQVLKQHLRDQPAGEFVFSSSHWMQRRSLAPQSSRFLTTTWALLSKHATTTQICISIWNASQVERHLEGPNCGVRDRPCYPPRGYARDCQDHANYAQCYFTWPQRKTRRIDTERASPRMHISN